MGDNVIIKFACNKIVLSLTFLLFLLIASNCLTASFHSFSGGYTGRMEINLYESGSKSGDGLIGLNNINTLTDEYKIVSFSSRADIYVRSSNAILPARAELTDSNYQMFSGIRITRGTYFSEDAFNNGRNVTVISEQMAAKLFMNSDAVGNEVELFGEKYMIVGVYSESFSIISLLGFDGRDRVYIPFTSIEQAHTLPIETVYINDEFIEKERFREKELTDNLKLMMKLNTARYKITDYYDTPVKLSQWASIAIFFVTVVCICLLARMAISYIRINMVYIKKRMNDMYPGEFLMSEMPYIIFLLAGIILLASFAAFVYFSARPAIMIPSRFIPQDNIFDFGFYTDIIKEIIREFNSLEGYVPTQLEKHCRGILILNSLILAAAVPIFLSMTSGIKLLKLAGGSVSMLVKIVVISCIFAVVSSALFSLPGGMVYDLPLKNIAVIVLFCALKFFDRNQLDGLMDHILNRFMKRGLKTNARFTGIRSKNNSD